MKHAIRLSIAGTVLLTAAVAAWSIGGEPPEADLNRQRIAAMSEAERDRVRRAQDEFRRLSPSERDSVRRLHQAVELQPDLKQAFLDYESFLGTLDPAEREELRQQPDPAKRLARVEAIVAERDSRGRGSSFGGRFIDGPILSPDRLDEASNVVLESLHLPASEEQRLRAIEEDHMRHLRIVQQAAEKVPSDRWRDPERSRERWPDDATLVAILELYPESQFRAGLLKDEADPGRREWQRVFRRSVAIGLLVRSLLAEWHDVALRVIDPETLRTAFEELPQGERDKLIGRPPGDLVRAAIRDVLAKREDAVGAFAKDFDEVADLRGKLDPFAHGFGGRRGPGGPFGGPDGGRRDGGRGDGPGDGRRGRPDRRDGPAPDGQRPD